jgi:dolichyl-phosphate-mannose-protein mannosyltransferase
LPVVLFLGAHLAFLAGVTMPDKLPSATFASLMLVYALRRGNTPRWLLWAFVAIAGASFAVMLPITAAFVGTSMQTFNRLMLFQNWI